MGQVDTHSANTNAKPSPEGLGLTDQEFAQLDSVLEVIGDKLFDEYFSSIYE